MRRTFNVRFFLVLLGAVSALACTGHGIHSIQVRRNAALLLDQAARAEEQGQFQQAAGALANYLAFVPEDTDALARYGLTLQRLASSVPARQRAHGVLEQVLRRDPGRQDVRRSVVRLALELGMVGDARRHLRALVEAVPDSEEFWRLLAWCEEGAGDHAQAAECLRKVIRRTPSDIASHVRLARLLRGPLSDPEGADEVMKGLMEANPGVAAAYLARANYRLETGAVDEAGEDLARARELEPGNSAAVLALVAGVVRTLHERGQLAAADRIVRRMEEAGPLGRELGRLSAEVALALRDQPRAVGLARRAAAEMTHDYREQLWLSQFLRRTAQFRDAEQVVRDQLKRSPRIPDVWVALVELLAVTNQRGRAANVLEDLRAALPEEQQPLTLARCHAMLGQREQAERYYEAVRKARPGDFLVIQEIATFWLGAGQFLRAEPFLRQLMDTNLQAPPETAAWARRQLAAGLARAGGDARYREALELVSGEGVADLRARAHILATRPEQRGEALRILTATEGRGPLSGDDRLLLARLYDAEGNSARAREQFLALLAGGAHDPGILAEYVRCLRRWGDEEEARAWTARLKEVAPGAVPLLGSDPRGAGGTGSPPAPR